MKNFKKTNIFISSVCLILIFTTISAFAFNTLMTYNGSGIRGKWSVGTFSINSNNSTFYVSHTQKWWYGGIQKMDITAYKQTIFGYTTNTGTAVVNGDGTFTITFSSKPSGVYKLYFMAEDSVNCADISGSVYN